MRQDAKNFVKETLGHLPEGKNCRAAFNELAVCLTKQSLSIQVECLPASSNEALDPRDVALYVTWLSRCLCSTLAVLRYPSRKHRPDSPRYRDLHLIAFNTRLKLEWGVLNSRRNRLYVLRRSLEGALCPSV